MTKELRRLSIIVLFMFLALFGATSWIQVVHADALNSDANNRRTLLDSFEVQRGSIIAGGSEIATSVASGNSDYPWMRTYTDPQVWSTVVGWSNAVLQANERLEGAMNQELSGTASSAFLDRIERILSGQDPHGSNVELTLDPAVQQAAYDALTSRGYTGAVVALEPSTGRILGMVSTPTYDNSTLTSLDPDAVGAAYDALNDDPTKPLLNRAISDVYPPGSTFKLVVASAALASGDYTMDSTLPNETSYTLPGTTTAVSNASGGTCGGLSADEVSIHDAIRYSCNVPMAELAVELGDEAIKEEAEKYGFNETFTTPLDVVASSYPAGLSDDAVGLTGFGQGEVTATPLQMAMVAAGIANDGVVMQPQMIESVIGTDLSVQESFAAETLDEALDPDLAEVLTEAMQASVQDGAATNATIEGVDVAGKTGTAETAGDGPYDLWFTGFAPADDPQIAVAVVILDGGGQGQSGSGNTIAAPVAKEVMEAVLSQ
ncbi:MAG: penicillin-binding transpeptidase domain-containing protein [Microbacterium sp.]